MRNGKDPEENPMLHDWEWDEYDAVNNDYDESAEEEALDCFYGAEE